MWSQAWIVDLQNNKTKEQNMNFELGQEIGRDQLGAAFLFVNERNETASEKWDVVSIAPDAWQIVVAAPVSREQEITTRIAQLQKMLADTDYKARKYLDGEYTEEEYAEIKAEAKAQRAEINQLEQELESIKGE